MSLLKITLCVDFHPFTFHGFPIGTYVPIDGNHNRDICPYWKSKDGNLHISTYARQRVHARFASVMRSRAVCLPRRSFAVSGRFLSQAYSVSMSLPSSNECNDMIPHLESNIVKLNIVDCGIYEHTVQIHTFTFHRYVIWTYVPIDNLINRDICPYR